MATKTYSASSVYIGDILVYEGLSGSLHGGKMLKEVWIEEIDAYRWIYQGGQVKGNQWVPSSDGKEVHMASLDDIMSSLDKKWTKDELSPVKGDILVGTDGDGKRVVLYFESSALIHRLTPGVGLQSKTGAGSLEFYRNQMKDLEVIKTSKSEGKLFSEI